MFQSVSKSSVGITKLRAGFLSKTPTQWPKGRSTSGIWKETIRYLNIFKFEQQMLHHLKQSGFVVKVWSSVQTSLESNSLFISREWNKQECEPGHSSLSVFFSWCWNGWGFEYELAGSNKCCWFALVSRGSRDFCKAMFIQSHRAQVKYSKSSEETRFAIFKTAGRFINYISCLDSVS